MKRNMPLPEQNLSSLTYDDGGGGGGGVGDIESGGANSADGGNSAGGGDGDHSENENDQVMNMNEPPMTAAAGKIPSQEQQLNRRWSAIFVILIMLVGMFASGLFLALGIKAGHTAQSAHFEQHADELTKEIEKTWEEYELVSLWLHNVCSQSRDTPRKEFRALYEHMTANGLEFQATSCAFNVSHAERAAMEERSREYYAANYPDIKYKGFLGLEADPNSNSSGEVAVRPRSEQPFYFPVLQIEPVRGNEAAIDFDLYSQASRRRTIEKALTTWEPAVTPRIRLVQETDPSAYSVILLHPGIPVSTDKDRKPRDLASLVVRIPSLLQRALRHTQHSVGVYIYQTSNDSDGSGNGEDNLFMGGASVTEGSSAVDSLEELEYKALQDSLLTIFKYDMQLAADVKWTVAVVHMDSAHWNLTFVIVGAVLIFCACAGMAVFIHMAMLRLMKSSQLAVQSRAEAEKATLLINAARQSAKNERELNDFIAHEIRNPLSAAMSGLSFVETEVNAKKPLPDEESIKSVREDLKIVKSSLAFINDLLRSMLDVHRAANKQMKIVKAPTDVMKDVFEPVKSMLYHRGGDFQVVLDCPLNLMVQTDKLRLTQVVLNLARNSAKFVTRGFVRIRAEVVDDDSNVELSIEDSGPGIPKDKQKKLFAKFQDSLDSLNQGTGIGLCLSRDLVDLMKGVLWLDETYNSGIEDCPGARFAIRLNEPPIHLNTDHLDAFEARSPSMNDDSEHHYIKQVYASCPESKSGESDSILEYPLPEKLSVLIVDDDVVVRKLFSRSIKRVAPDWSVQEASSGEACLSMVLGNQEHDQHEFDLIFIDQYMASVEKQLLGTETVAALRSKGNESKLCGLSANDMEGPFIKAGADFFILKPIPCSKDGLTKELRRILLQERGWHGKETSNVSSRH